MRYTKKADEHAEDERSLFSLAKKVFLKGIVIPDQAYWLMGGRGFGWQRGHFIMGDPSHLYI